jgi:5S rRNA maturation endonuclease (ribonuclease M5)
MTEAPILEALRALPKQKPGRNGWTNCLCPAHKDGTASFGYIVHDDGHVGLQCLAGCTAEAIVAALGCSFTDLYPPRAERRIDAVYAYHDADGSPQYDVVRFYPKDFRQRRADGTWSMQGVKRVPYRLPELLASTKGVVIVEGEKDVDRLASLGIVATTNPGGAGKWRAEFAEYLTGRIVVVIPDNDEPGRAHADDVARSLRGIAARVALLELPDAKPKGDVSDWLNAGHDVAELKALLPDAPKWTPRPVPALGIDAADLLELDLPALRWVVPDIIPEGTTILASPPKVGKSCFIYQVAVEASLGGEFLGRRVTPGSVLYLALEDGRRRGQTRLRAALAGRTMPRGRLEVRWSARKIGAGLEEDIEAWLDAHPDAILVAIDTLGKVRPTNNGRRNAYEIDVENFARLQDIFRDRPVALVIVHHARKESHDDFLASVSGTYGITGSVDTTIVVKRLRLETFGTILVTGRDVPDAEIPAQFDGLTWQPALEQLSQASFERREVYSVIETDGPIFPASIGLKTGLGRTSVQNMVTALVADGLVIRTTGGYVVALARARVSIVPGDSSDSESHQSHGAHKREEAPGSYCSDPLGHAFLHFATDTGRRCRQCSPLVP